MIEFSIEHWPIPTHRYAELWSAEPFRVNFWYSDGREHPAEHKGDERGIGAHYKLDVIAPAWAGWEGTDDQANRVLWIVQAADEAALDGDPPAPPLLPLRRGVNVATWREGDDGNGENGDENDDEGENGNGDEENGDEPGPLPPVNWVPRLIAFYGLNTSIPSAVKFGDELIYSIPKAWLREAYTATVALFGRVVDVEIVERERPVDKWR